MSNAVSKILRHQTEGAIILHLGSCPCNPCNGKCGGSRRSTDRHSTSWWRSRWFRSWKRPSRLPAVGGLTGGTPRTSCGGQPSDLLVLFVTEYQRSPKCLRDALLSFELEEIRHGLRAHGHELEHCGHSPKLIMKARLGHHLQRHLQREEGDGRGTELFP
jgi:hypothetical protein